MPLVLSSKKVGNRISSCANCPSYHDYCCMVVVMSILTSAISACCCFLFIYFSLSISISSLHYLTMPLSSYSIGKVKPGAFSTRLLSDEEYTAFLRIKQERDDRNKHTMFIGNLPHSINDVIIKNAILKKFPKVQIKSIRIPHMAPRSVCHSLSLSLSLSPSLSRLLSNSIYHQKMVVMTSILTSPSPLLPAAFYSYLPHFPSSSPCLHYAHYTLIIVYFSLLCF